MNPLTAITHWIRRRRRVRELRSLYIVHLRESTSSLDERVRFHLEHIAEYWDRCLGFRAQVSAEGIVASDLFACVYIGTDAANDDALGYCAERKADSLGEAWQHYEMQVDSLRRGVSDARQDLDSCACDFRSVWNLYAASAEDA